MALSSVCCVCCDERHSSCVRCTVARGGATQLWYLTTSARSRVPACRSRVHACRWGVARLQHAWAACVVALAGAMHGEATGQLFQELEETGRASRTMLLHNGMKNERSGKWSRRERGLRAPALFVAFLQP